MASGGDEDVARGQTMDRSICAANLDRVRIENHSSPFEDLDAGLFQDADVDLVQSLDFGCLQDQREQREKDKHEHQMSLITGFVHQIERFALSY